LVFLRETEDLMAHTFAVGLLLAAGRGERFRASRIGSAEGAAGADKLMARLADGTPVVVAAARVLVACLPRVLAVVRPGSPGLVEALHNAGCEIVVCDDADQGMGASLARGARFLLDEFDGNSVEAFCMVALGDMPWVREATLSALAAMMDTCRIAAPVYRGDRGHPVCFDRQMWPELAMLTGDRGANSLLVRHGASLLETDDPGVVRDIDTIGDLA
jgi:molybdenum cofactor cytidylyltransferase